MHSHGSGISQVHPWTADHWATDDPYMCTSALEFQQIAEGPYYLTQKRQTSNRFS